MKKRCKNSEEKNLLPFHIIKAASEGDVMAINTVLKHYEGSTSSSSFSRTFACLEYADNPFRP